jgi:hypothetical protein
MSTHFIKLVLITSALLAFIFELNAQCEPGQVNLSMNIYTDPWGYETYWEIVPGTNSCGDGTIVWGSNLEAVGCSGGGEANAYGTETAYPSNTVVPVENICLNAGELYTLYFVDDWGDGGLYFEMFQDGSLTGIYAGTGIGNAWTFEAGNNPLGPFDSPCNAATITPGVASSIDLNNSNCYTQVNEIHPIHAHCAASGTWCPDEVTKTIWAKFTVPDEGSFEVSTVHNGTYINTQLAVYVAEDCAAPENFILVSANDNFWGESGIVNCDVEVPSCVNRASAAFDNVISELPQCCSAGWSQDCQDLYDSFSPSCEGFSGTCPFLLEGFDSYGDGWNDCFITVTINGESTDYTFYEGNYQSWILDLEPGDQVSISFTPAAYPEEVTVSLKHPDGTTLFNVQPVTLAPLFFDQTVSCSGDVSFHPEASRCYVNCLPAGTECYIQIDGFNNESGNIVLSVKPYDDEPEIFTEITDLTCPTGAGSIPDGLIVTFIEGWGLNYLPQWEGSNGYASNDYHPNEIMDGVYTLNAADNCGNQLSATYTVDGPVPFFFSSSSQSVCPGVADGSVSTVFSGGTSPYDFYWLLPDSSVVESTSMENLLPGTYQFHLTDQLGCSIIEPVTVEMFAAPDFNLGEDFTVCDEFMIQLQGPPNMVDYEWSVGSQSQNAVVSDDDFDLGTYPISLTVFNTAGCSASDTLMMQVIACTGVEYADWSQVALYPQPANNLFALDRLPALNLTIEVVDISGRVMQSQSSFAQSRMEFNCEQLASGIYLLKMSSASEYNQITFTIQH